MFRPNSRRRQHCFNFLIQLFGINPLIQLSLQFYLQGYAYFAAAGKVEFLHVLSCIRVSRPYGRLNNSHI